MSYCERSRNNGVGMNWFMVGNKEAVRAGAGVFWVAGLGMEVNAPNLVPELLFPSTITDEQIHSPTLL